MPNSEVMRVKSPTLKFSLNTGLFLNGALCCAAVIIRHSPVIASPFGALLNPHQLFHSSRSSNNVWPSSSFVIAARCLPVQVYGERCTVCFGAAISGHTFGLTTLSHRKWLFFICYCYIRLAKKPSFHLLFLFIGKNDGTPPSQFPHFTSWEIISSFYCNVPLLFVHSSLQALALHLCFLNIPNFFFFLFFLRCHDSRLWARLSRLRKWDFIFFVCTEQFTRFNNNLGKQPSVGAHASFLQSEAQTLDCEEQVVETHIWLEGGFEMRFTLHQQHTEHI